MTSNKKDDHVKLAKTFHNRQGISDFDQLRFVHHSFPEMSLDEVDITASIASFKMEQPFFINAMTGGSDKTKLINERLATVAREAKLAMASGSLSAAIKDPSLVDSFQIIRKTNPNGLVFANLGAEHEVDAAKRAIDILEANVLQIHVNSLQELIMPEGDRDFSKWLNNIEKIVHNIEIPLMVKEVGVGISRQTIKRLIDIGVKTIDVSGTGGTNFARIENYRRNRGKIDYLENFGQSTAISLLESQEYVKSTEIIASGGIRNPLDIVKVLSLGARAVGISGLILNMVQNDGVDNTIVELNNWKAQIKIIMTLLGKREICDLVYTDLIISNAVKDWCLARMIPYENFANRCKMQNE